MTYKAGPYGKCLFGQRDLEFTKIKRNVDTGLSEQKPAGMTFVSMVVWRGPFLGSEPEEKT